MSPFIFLHLCAWASDRLAPTLATDAMMFAAMPTKFYDTLDDAGRAAFFSALHYVGAMALTSQRQFLALWPEHAAASVDVRQGEFDHLLRAEVLRAFVASCRRGLRPLDAHDHAVDWGHEVFRIFRKHRGHEGCEQFDHNECLAIADGALAIVLRTLPPAAYCESGCTAPPVTSSPLPPLCGPCAAAMGITPTV